MKIFEVLDNPFQEIESSPGNAIDQYNKTVKALELMKKNAEAKGDEKTKIAVMKKMLEIDPTRILAKVKLDVAKASRANAANPGGKTAERNPKYEKLLKIHPVYAAQYAQDVLKGRFIEAEPYIIQDPQVAYYYFQHIMTPIGTDPVRWPEAEASFATVPKIAYDYAVHVIDDRWPEGESAIKQDPKLWDTYKKRFELTL